MPYCPLCDKQSPCKHWPTEARAEQHEAYDRLKALRDLGLGMHLRQEEQFLGITRNGMVRWLYEPTPSVL